jgi:hypothetical protein
MDPMVFASAALRLRHGMTKGERADALHDGDADR